MTHPHDPAAPDDPEKEDIPREHWRSDCCGEPVTDVVEFRGVRCTGCNQFCRVDVDESLAYWRDEK